METTGLRPGTQDDKMKMEPTGHSSPVTGSTIAFAKPVTSARNSFSSLRTLDTEGTADAGEWRPGAGCCVSNALLLPQDHCPIQRRDQMFQELLVCEKEDQSATGTTKQSATLDERYLVSGARLKIYTLFPKDKLKEFDGMSFARQLLYARQQQSLKTGVESKIQDWERDPFQERDQDPWKGKELHPTGTGSASSNDKALEGE